MPIFLGKKVVQFVKKMKKTLSTIEKGEEGFLWNLVRGDSSPTRERKIISLLFRPTPYEKESTIIPTSGKGET